MWICMWMCLRQWNGKGANNLNVNRLVLPFRIALIGLLLSMLGLSLQCSFYKKSLHDNSPPSLTTGLVSISMIVLPVLEFCVSEIIQYEPFFSGLFCSVYANKIHLEIFSKKKKKYLCKKNYVSTFIWSSNYGNTFKSFK